MFGAGVDIPAFCDALALFKLGVSWGGHESLVVPALVTRVQAAGPNSAVDFGVPERMVRLHVGLEGTEALWADLAQALSGAPPIHEKTPRRDLQNAETPAPERHRRPAWLLGAAARADTTLKLVEVITSPERTETLKGIVAGFEKSHPGVHVEITSLAWGSAFEKFATMVSAGDTPDVVEMPDRWLSLYAGNGGRLESLEPYLAKWDRTAGLNDRALELGRYVDKTAYMLPYGFYLRALFYNKVLFKQAGIDAPPKTIEDFAAAAKKVSALPGKSGYCLRGGPGGLNGWMMFGATMAGSADFFKPDNTSTLSEPDWIKGTQFLVDLYKSGGAPKDSVNWGFNEIVAGFYSGTCAMLDQDPDALIAIAQRMKPEEFGVATMPKGPSGRAYPTLGYAGWSMFKASQHKDLDWELIADARRPRGQHRLEPAHRRPADLQGRRAGPLLQGRTVQGLVRRALRQGRGAADHADLPAGLRLFRRFHRGEVEPAGAARPDHPRGHEQAMGGGADQGQAEGGRQAMRGAAVSRAVAP